MLKGTGRDRVRSLLIHRIGSLGDTLVALPALWAVRDHFPNHHVTLLSEKRPGRTLVAPRDILSGSDVCDEFLEYPADGSLSGRVARPWRMAVLLATLRSRRFESLIYLAPSRRSRRQIWRDQFFFRAARIRCLLGVDGFQSTPDKRSHWTPDRPTREADFLLRRLAASGVPVPPPGQGCMELGLGAKEEKQVELWLSGLPNDGGRRWISVGPGARKPVSRWPIERYRAVVDTLVKKFDVWPAVFGGPEDAHTAEILIRAWGRGYSAAGSLDVRSTMAAMKRCQMHLGNDTGTMHMAAAVSVPCVGVFASHNAPGVWYPYGEGHHVIRTDVDCAGCQLRECFKEAHRCLLSITVEQVTQACVDMLIQPTVNHSARYSVE
jgi:heptosyltransferase III